LNFFFKGKFSLYGYGSFKNSEKRYKVTNLPEESFFGDFEILFDLPAKFDL
jgi:hypothetical protein